MSVVSLANQALCARSAASGLSTSTSPATRSAFVAPPTTIEPLDESQLRAITEALGFDQDLIVRSARLDNGPVFPAIHLASAEAVLALDSSRVRWPTFDAIGFIGPHPTGSECEYEVRLLAPSSGMSEDPITGSLNAALAFWLREAGLLEEPLTISQGTSIGRHGRVYVRPTGDRILIGGDTNILIEGDVTL